MACSVWVARGEVQELESQSKIKATAKTLKCRLAEENRILGSCCAGSPEKSVATVLAILATFSSNLMRTLLPSS